MAHLAARINKRRGSLEGVGDDDDDDDDDDDEDWDDEDR